ncbi:MAG TPA: hypothetical protein VFB22_13090 [Candidatus Baltobacteraceae bacterium]|nr:hypothetical protein [Candidatus Baltobacteraceae bacterium]
MRALRRCAAPLLALFLLGAGAAPLDVENYPSPRVVLSEDAHGAVLWWDATPWVERFLLAQTPSDGALRALEIEAVKLFVTRVPALPPGTRRLRVLVVFAKTGLADPHYQTSSFEGVRTLLTVEGDLRPHMTFAPDWESRAKAGTFPSGLSVTPNADLPRNG